MWAKVGVVGGLPVVLAAFAVGTEHQDSTAVAGRTQSCGAAIPASWLVSGTPDAAHAEDGRPGTTAACALVIRRTRVVLLTTMGVGGIVALVGWTAIRTRREVEPPEPAAVPAQGLAPPTRVSRRRVCADTPVAGRESCFHAHS